MAKKLSCLPVSIYPLFQSGEIDIPAWSREAATIGFDMFDLGEASISSLTVEELRKIRENCIIPFNMLSAYSDFTNPDPALRASSIADAKEKIRKVHALGGKFIRIPGGPAHPEAVAETDQYIEIMCECFNECIPLAKELGVRIVFENDSQPPAWDTPNFCFDLDRFVRAWKKLRQLDIGFNYDTGNAFFLNQWDIILNAVLGDIETLHITDYYYEGKTFKTIVFGEGNVPIRQMLQMIKDSGFDGMISMEDTTFQGLSGMAKSYAFTREICNEIFND